jgi:hypothetical protein
MRRIWQTVKYYGGRSISVALFVLGVLYFWPDIRDLPAVYGYRWGQLMPDRESVAYVLLGLALLWIIWMDVRPAVLRQRRTFGLIRVTRFEVAEVIKNPSGEEVGIRLRFYVENHSSIRVYVSVERISVSIDGMINPDERRGVLAFGIDPGREQEFTLAGIKWLEKKDSYEGRDDIEIRYGASVSRLPYLLHHRGLLPIRLAFREGQRVEHNVSCSHMTVDHKRLV